MSSMVRPRATNWQAVPDTSAHRRTFSISTLFMTPPRAAILDRWDDLLVDTLPWPGRSEWYEIRTASRGACGYRLDMKSYGQFCSIARALDLLGERWTLLIVRELLC